MTDGCPAPREVRDSTPPGAAAPDPHRRSTRRTPAGGSRLLWIPVITLGVPGPRLVPTAASRSDAART